MATRRSTRKRGLSNTSNNANTQRRTSPRKKRKLNNDKAEAEDQENANPNNKPKASTASGKWSNDEIYDLVKCGSEAQWFSGGDIRINGNKMDNIRTNMRTKRGTKSIRDKFSVIQCPCPGISLMLISCALIDV